MGDSAGIDPTLRASLLASVAELKVQLREVQVRIADDQAKERSIQKRIDGALEFLGEGGEVRAAAAGASSDVQNISSEAGAPGRPSGRPGTWTAFFYDRLNGRNGGMTLKELLATIPGTEYAEKLAAGRNGFYTSVSKLTADGKLVRRKDTVYLPHIAAKVDAGEIVEPPREPKADKRGVYLLIELVVRGGPADGMKAADVVDVMRGMPEAQPYLRRNTQLVYATLSRMVQAGLLERNWQGRYRVAEKRQATDDSKVVTLPTASNGGTR